LAGFSKFFSIIGQNVVHFAQMSASGNGWASLASTLRSLSQLLPGQSDPSDEAGLYYRRACLAASEERYDVALVFATKAIEVEPRHLAARLLLARIHDRGLGNLEAAVAGYKKVIALAGYDGANPHCVAAREALDSLVCRSQTPAPASA
jgi:tetratricopeptide (TPR) repeat protein